MTDPAAPKSPDAPGAKTTEQKADRAPGKVTHPDRAARRSIGKDARRTVPLESHAEVAVDGRPDPVDLLEGQAASRVPELVPIRYGRMTASPFAFYRGGALIMRLSPSSWNLRWRSPA